MVWLVLCSLTYTLSTENDIKFTLRVIKIENCLFSPMCLLMAGDGWLFSVTAVNWKIGFNFSDHLTSAMLNNTMIALISVRVLMK